MANDVLRWERLREEEFEGAIERSGGLCVFSLGCLEKHGQHLPVGTDTLKGQRIVEMAAAEADVTVFPATPWLGNVIGAHTMEHPEDTNRRGYIAISGPTMLTVLAELCDEIARNGYRKILLCNSHGGNTSMLNYFITNQNYTKKKYATMWTPAYNWASIMPAKVLEAYEKEPEFLSMLTEEDLEVLRRFAKTGTGGGHGDFVETSLVYGTYPELVEPSRFDAEDGAAPHVLELPEGVVCAKTWSVNHPYSFDGFAPIGCSRTIGDAVVKLSIRRLASIMRDLKNREDVVRYQETGIL